MSYNENNEGLRPIKEKNVNVNKLDSEEFKFNNNNPVIITSLFNLNLQKIQKQLFNVKKENIYQE